MFKETDQGQGIKPVQDKKERPSSGMISFDSLPDNPVIAEEINQFILKEQIKELQGKIEESEKRLQELKETSAK